MNYRRRGRRAVNAVGKWFRQHGYETIAAEVSTGYSTRDILGSDLIALRMDGGLLCFVQVKSHRTKPGNDRQAELKKIESLIRKAQRQMDGIWPNRTPGGVLKVIVWWGDQRKKERRIWVSRRTGKWQEVEDIEDMEEKYASQEGQ